MNDAPFNGAILEIVIIWDRRILQYHLRLGGKDEPKRWMIFSVSYSDFNVLDIFFNFKLHL